MRNGRQSARELLESRDTISLDNHSPDAACGIGAAAAGSLGCQGECLPVDTLAEVLHNRVDHSET